MTRKIPESVYLMESHHDAVAILLGFRSLHPPSFDDEPSDIRAILSTAAARLSGHRPKRGTKTTAFFDPEVMPDEVYDKLDFRTLEFKKRDKT